MCFRRDYDSATASDLQHLRAANAGARCEYSPRVFAAQGADMSLIDKAKQHFQSAAGAAHNAAGAALEAGQSLSAQAQSQVALRKLQIEQARKTHDLGKETYAWHQSGTMIVSGPVPRNVQMLCFQLDDLSEKIETENRQLEEIRQAAALRAQQNAASPDIITTTIVVPDADAATPAAASTADASLAPQLTSGASTRPLPHDDTIS